MLNITDFPIEYIIDIKVVSLFFDNDSDIIQIDDYYLISYWNKTLEIQIDFRNPNHLSLNSINKDNIMISFEQPWFFTDY